MTTRMFKSADVYTKLTPALYLFLCAIGYFHNEIYYSRFRVNILKYMEVKDFFWGGINYLAPILISIICLTVINWILASFFSSLFKKKVKEEDIKFYSYVVSFILVMIVATIILYIWFKQSYYLSIAIMVFFIFGMFCLNSQIGNIGMNFRILLLGTFAVVTLIFYGSALLKEPSDYIEFTYNDKFVTTETNELFFIGETSSYLFLYNSETDLATAFEKSQLSYLSYR